MNDIPLRSFLKQDLWVSKWLGHLRELFWVLLCTLALTTLLLVHRANPLDWRNAGGLAIITISVIVLTRFHVRHTPLGGVVARTAERILWIGSLAAVAGVQILTESLGRRSLEGVGYLMCAPILATAMLLSALLGPAISLFCLTTICFLLGISGALSIDFLVVSWLAAAVGAHAVNPLKQRSDLLRAMSIVAVAQGTIAAGTTAMQVATVRPVIESMGWAVLSAVIATSIFWLGVIVVEKIFGLVSDWSLLELCSPEHPVLKELTLRAPGTYAHSVMVGNLAENAARAIGANPVLVRALAYFHDIGKLERPSYFIENQVGENPHDTLPPHVSARILAAHVSDGIELAKKHRLPKQIWDGIHQHHGTSLMTYFYGRAIEDHEPTPELESSFRYSGPRPQTRELAVLHLADSVEAVSRSIPRGSTEELEIAIKRIIEERRADGQLDECDLTFRDLRTIETSFLRSLGALRHERIAYPEDVLTHAPEAPSHLDLEQLRSTYPNQED